MMNRGDFDAYQRLVRPLYASPDSEIVPGWIDTVAQTLQMRLSHSGFTINDVQVVEFLRSSRSNRQKRELIVSYVQTALLSLESGHEVVVANFIKFIGIVGDRWPLSAPEHVLYRRSLRLIASSSSERSVEAHLHSLEDNFESKDQFSLFLTALAGAVAEVQPSTAIAIWTMKTEAPDVLQLTPLDLYNHMRALRCNRKYEDVLKVYEEHTELHADEQIEVLLAVCEDLKNWRALQAHFEQMYGRNHLPHAVHYGIVMNALASLGIGDEVAQLYEQMGKRNLAPTAAVFIALIKLRLYNNDADGARRYFGQFMEQVKQGVISEDNVPCVQAKLFEMHMSGNVFEAMDALENILAHQAKLGVVFVDEALICKMTEYAASVYSQDAVSRLLALAQKLDCLSLEVFAASIHALTRLGLYQEAEDLAYEAHQSITDSFRSARILSAQLRNYRAWYKDTADRRLRLFLADQEEHIVHMLEQKQVSADGISALHADVINYYVKTHQLSEADELLASISQPMEMHYVPLLNLYSSLNSYSGQSRTLELYRDMTRRGASVSARSYAYLMRALIQMDKVAGSGQLTSSTKLLGSVFELYGFSVNVDTEAKKVSVEDLVMHAPLLLKLLSDYAVAAGPGSEMALDVAVRFLTYIRATLHLRLPVGFRIAIFAEMGRMYEAAGLQTPAHDMVDRALGEISEMVKINQRGRELAAEEGVEVEDDTDFDTGISPRPGAEFDIQIRNTLASLEKSPSHSILPSLNFINRACPRPFQLPRPLQLEFRRVAQLKLQLLRGRVLYDALVKLARQCLDLGVRLGGSQLQTMSNAILMPAADFADGSGSVSAQEEVDRATAVALVLELSERYLVSGNWAAISVQRRLQSMYKLLMVIMSTDSSFGSFFRQLAPLNTYYGITDIDHLCKQYAGLEDPRGELRRLLEAHTHDQDFGIAELRYEIPNFFVPENLVQTKNTVAPAVALLLVENIEKISLVENPLPAFHLYDRFPETMEYLLMFNENRTRLVRFRQEIDQLKPPLASGAPEDAATRRNRAVEALQGTQDQV